MATSNRDRIGQMFDALAPALDDVHHPRVGAANCREGHTWTQLLALKDAKNGASGKKYSATRSAGAAADADREHHRTRSSTGWYPFDGQLSRVQQSYASELRDVRNGWAHDDSFNDDDAYRALDTAERLLPAIGATDAATEVARIRLNLRRVTADKDDRRTLKAVATTADSAGLKPWREVLQPHDDVATGNFQASEFAADLYKVARARRARTTPTRWSSSPAPTSPTGCRTSSSARCGGCPGTTTPRR